MTPPAKLLAPFGHGRLSVSNASIARGRKARPPGDKTGGRRARSNSTRPNSSSSAFICTVTADCVRLTERDAAAKEPLSAMAKKVRRSRIDTIISIKFQVYAQHISISSSRKQAEHG